MIKLRSGKELDPNRGFIGLSDKFEISEGYDSEIYRYAHRTDFGYEEDEDPANNSLLTDEECVELCDYMIARWNEFKISLLKLDVQGEK